jgi:ABC-type polysaccharide/polyol phosphate transport system ATPase subunit
VSEPALSVHGLSKTFRLPHELRTTVREYFVHPFQRVRYEVQHALTDVSFEVEEGEFFGIIGPNGSGKSTLLKIVSGIYPADAGSVRVTGRLSPFIELGVGFNPELNARDNIRINGTLLGLTPQQLEEKLDEIVAFAELERFVDQRLKNYSSGMQVRLAYSIAIQVPFEILLLDEVLAVGDENFQHKCFATFEDMRRAGKTILLVTHDLRSVTRLCDRALLLRAGAVQALGEPYDVVETYLRQESARMQATPMASRTLKDQEIIERLAQSRDELLNTLDQDRAKVTTSVDPAIQNASEAAGRRPHGGAEPDAGAGSLERRGAAASEGRRIELERALADANERLRSVQLVSRRRELVLNAVLQRHLAHMDMPPVDLRIVDELSYLAKGATTSEIVMDTFGREPAGPILEWNPRDGRTLRWLLHIPAWRRCYHGCEPSAEAVAWLAAQGVPNMRALADPLNFPYDDGFFAGAFSFSIPRSLHPDDYRTWFAETRRVLGSGAEVVLGIHGLRVGERIEKHVLGSGWARDGGGYVVTDEYVRTAVADLMNVESVTALGSHGYRIYTFHALAGSTASYPSAAATVPNVSKGS